MFTNSPIDRLTDLPISLVVSVDASYQYATKNLKRKAKNHNLKFKTFFV